MVWKTAIGKRTLRGAEAKLICNSAWSLVDTIRAEESFDSSAQFGIVLFDRLTWQQQLVLLDKVLAPLVDKSIPAPPATALMDATLAAIYAQLRQSIEVEIDLSRDPYPDEEKFNDTRLLVTETLQAISYDEDLEIPDPECSDMGTWELLVESLQSRMLADEDWQMDGLTLDLPPDKSQAIKQVMGIHADYFTDIPPDATYEQARSAWVRIIERVSGIRPDEQCF